MHNKFDVVKKLAPDLQKRITPQNLSNHDLVKLARTSKYHLKLFQPLIDIRKLLHHVTRGKHDVVKTMLKKDMTLIFKRGVITECSGRVFEKVSSFEYAL